MNIQELEDYIAQLSENERDYAREMESALLDEVDSAWPDAADHCISDFRALEISGVLSHFFEEYLTAQRENLQTIRLEK